MTWPLSPLTKGAYGAIVADPPWAFKTRTPAGLARSAESHYRTEGTEWICGLPVADLAAKDCHLFLWITGPHLVRGDHVRIMEAWGFKPSSMHTVWLKNKRSAALQDSLFTRVDESAFVMGMGHTTRQNAEYVVLGRRGSPQRATKSMHQLLIQPRREHSRKPEAFRDRVEGYCLPGTRICELFARQGRPGWDTWGNESTKFDNDNKRRAA